MLDANLKTQLKAYLERVTQPIELVASLDDRAGLAGDARTAAGHRRPVATRSACAWTGTDARRPSFSISRAGHDMGVRFAAIPMGHEFTSLVLALLQAGGHPPKVDADVIEQIQALEGDFVFETYMSLTCHNCPDVVQALNLMAVLNPRVRHVAIDGGLFKAEVEARQIMAVPTVYLNGQLFGSRPHGAGRDPGQGRHRRGRARRRASWPPRRRSTCSSSAAARPAPPRRCTPRARASAPASWPSASAARRWTRWPSRTSSRCSETEGPKFAAALEAHVRAYDVDIMNGQRVAALEPAAHARRPRHA